MLQQLPLYWKYEKDSYEFLIARNNKTGFTKQEAEIIAPQLIEDSKLCAKLNSSKYKKVSIHNKNFYVLIDVIGKITKPRLKNQTYGLTSDSSKILGYREKEEY